jgi:hypothetical protein
MPGYHGKENGFPFFFSKSHFLFVWFFFEAFVFVLLFCSAGDQTQGLAHIRQADPISSLPRV